MVEWAVTSTGIRGFGREGDVRVEATDWRPHANDETLPRAVDAAVSGSATGLRLPVTQGYLVGTGGRYDLSSVRRLPTDSYTLTLEDGVETTVSFSGAVRVDRLNGRTVIRFGGRRPVTVGFREPATRPSTIRVPRSPEGVARAISVAAGTPETAGPERSHPTARPHPPLVEFGEEAVPQSVETERGLTGVEFHLPPAYEPLYVVAPLAYYTGATVSVGARTPTVRIPSLDLERHFAPGAAFADEVATVLRRLFFLDCYVRDTEGPNRLRPDGTGAEAELDAYASSTMGERLAMALSGGPEGVDVPLPEWHLSTYVSADPTNARAVPHLLDRLSLVYPPDASELDGQSLLKRTLDDFYRGRGTRQYRAAGGEVATAERLDPELREGHVHAWLADGIPIMACKTSTTAYENRLRHTSESRERLAVDVVLNDAEMLEERTVADIYRERSADLPVDVRVHESLTRRELAAVFESETDFVHYVGHCEVSGLKCADGYLPTARLDVGARTFFLNACGSYREGLALVEGGAGAGAVTLTKVLNEQAATVGTAFARLLIAGFGIERALALARRQILMGQDYAVVGDGTYTLAPADGDPALVRLSGGPDRYEVDYEVVTGRCAGRSYRSPFDGSQRLQGTTTTETLSRTELTRFLGSHDLPVVIDGDLYWGKTLAQRFQ
jgi:hypothetical protein